MNTLRLPQERALLTHRLVEVPVPDDDAAVEVPGRHRVLSSLTMAHAAGRPVVVAWVRPWARGPVHVFVGGVITGPQDDDAPVMLPVGARGRRVAADAVEAALGRLSWEVCQLAVDAASVVTESLSDRLEDFFAVSSDPIGFLVVARPLDDKQVGATVDTHSDEIARLEAHRSGRGVLRRRLERVEANLDYYDRSAGAGCWQLELWTGGEDARGAGVAAAVLAGSADLAEVPLLARPERAEVASQLEWARSCVVGGDAAAAVVRPPFRELPGVRTVRQPAFDQNVEERGDVRLGSLLDGARSPAAPFGVSLDSVNRHVFVSGATGSGKSETVRSLLLGLNRRSIPWMVIEPVKAEYAGLGPWLSPNRPVVVIRPGDPHVPPPMVNPLEPASIVVNGTRRLFPLQTYLDMVRALFTASFDAEEPFPQVLGAGLTQAYQARGWNLVTSTASDPALAAPEWPVLGDLVRESLDVVERLGYSAEVRSNMRGFIRVRVESLRTGTPGRFFEGGYPLDVGDLLTRPVVFEVEDLGDDRDKAFFIGTLVIRLVELLRLRQLHGLQQPGLSHVLVIEEAHRLLRRVAEESPSAHAVTMFANLLAEIRAYGEGVVVAEQIPSKVISDLVKNSAVKIMHRLPAEDDRAVVGATMNLGEPQSRHVVALPPGTAVAHSAGMDRPVLVRIDLVRNQSQTGADRGEPTLGPRSQACPGECARDRCTLGQLEASRDLVTPEVALWAEQFVLAHLTWDPIGRPTGPWFDKLGSADPKRSRCAVGLAIAAAVGRRGELVRAWHDPAAFETDLAQRMAAQLTTGRGINRPPWRWAIGQFRFTSIRRELRSSDDGDVAGPHPKTARWQASGISVEGTTWAEQLASAEALMDVGSWVHAWQLAGSPPMLDELARSAGFTDGTSARRIARALRSLGLEYKWVTVRVGARDE